MMSNAFVGVVLRGHPRIETSLIRGITHNVIFGETKLPIKKWFIAIYLLSTTSKGISSVQLAKHVGVTQKTGWFMDHRIRAAMKQNKGQLFGTIEVDETHIGGLEKNKHQSKRKHVCT